MSSGWEKKPQSSKSGTTLRKSTKPRGSRELLALLSYFDSSPQSSHILNSHIDSTEKQEEHHEHGTHYRSMDIEDSDETSETTGDSETSLLLSSPPEKIMVAFDPFADDDTEMDEDEDDDAYHSDTQNVHSMSQSSGHGGPVKRMKRSAIDLYSDLDYTAPKKSTKISTSRELTALMSDFDSSPRSSHILSSHIDTIEKREMWRKHKIDDSEESDESKEISSGERSSRKRMKLDDEKMDLDKGDDRSQSDLERLLSRSMLLGSPKWRITKKFKRDPISIALSKRGSMLPRGPHYLIRDSLLATLSTTSDPTGSEEELKQGERELLSDAALKKVRHSGSLLHESTVLDDDDADTGAMETTGKDTLALNAILTGLDAGDESHKENETKTVKKTAKAYRRLPRDLKRFLSHEDLLKLVLYAKSTPKKSPRRRKPLPKIEPPEKFHAGSLTTDLTVDLLLESKVESEDKLWPDQVVVADITTGIERPDTRYGATQESHTVAWTFILAALRAEIRGRTVADALMYLQKNLLILDRFMVDRTGDSGRQVLSYLAPMVEGVHDFSFLVEMSKVPMFPDTMRLILSRAITIFLQCHQLSSHAVYKRGNPLGHGEAKAMKSLFEQEEILNDDGQASLNGSNLCTYASKFLDVQFRKQALGVWQYAFAVVEWITNLYTLFPKVMNKYGEVIVGNVLKTALPVSFYTTSEPQDDVLYWKSQVIDQTLGSQPPSPKVYDLVDRFMKGYVKSESQNDKTLSSSSTTKDNEWISSSSITKKDESISSSSTTKVDKSRESRFLTNILSQIKAFQTSLSSSASTSSTSGKSDTSSLLKSEFQAVVYLVPAWGRTDDLENQYIKRIDLGNSDRPVTKYITKQQRHTVAWTLSRAALQTFTGVHAGLLVDHLDACFTTLEHEVKEEKEDARTKEIKQMIAEGRRCLRIMDEGASFKSSERTEKYSYYLGQAATNYMKCSQAVGSASFELGGSSPGGGEGTHMGTLRVNEYALGRSKVPHVVDNKDKITAAATGLFDFGAVILPDDLFNRARADFLLKLALAFPRIMRIYGRDVAEKFAEIEELHRNP